MAGSPCVAVCQELTHAETLAVSLLQGIATVGRLELELQRRTKSWDFAPIFQPVNVSPFELQWSWGTKCS